MMRTLFPCLLLLALVTATPATAQSLGDADRAAIRSVIEAQLGAFRRDDGVAAFSYASPTIRAKFRTAEIFMDMVRNGYRMVYRPREVEFREARILDGRPVQEVLFVGPDNQAVIAVYFLEQEDDGSWKIDGVYLLRSPQSVT
jgi:hypothetical protein